MEGGPGQVNPEQRLSLLRLVGSCSSRLEAVKKALEAASDEALQASGCLNILTFLDAGLASFPFAVLEGGQQQPLKPALPKRRITAQRIEASQESLPTLNPNPSNLKPIERRSFEVKAMEASADPELLKMLHDDVSLTSAYL